MTILDGTEENAKKYADATFTDENAGVYVDYFNLNAPQTRAGQAPGFVPVDKINGVGTVVNSDATRHYKWSLDLFPEKINGQSRMTLGLYQVGGKGRDGRTIKTRYFCQVVEFRPASNTFDMSGYRVVQSDKGRGGRYYYIATSYGQKFPSFHIVINHYSQGCPAVQNMVLDYNGTYDKCYLRMFYGKS